MGYNIFTVRKLMLTNHMNNTNLDMMKVQFERDSLQEQLMDLYGQLIGFDINKANADGLTSTDTQEMANRSTDHELSKEDKEKIKAEIEQVQIQEDRLDQYLKKLETEYSKAQNEIQSVESQEAQEIKQCTPHYSGVPQQ